MPVAKLGKISNKHFESSQKLLKKKDVKKMKMETFFRFKVSLHMDLVWTSCSHGFGLDFLLTWVWFGLYVYIDLVWTFCS